MGCSTFSNFTVLPEIALAKVNPDAPFDKICYIGCGVTTGIGAVINTAKVEIGATAVVFGLGGIGLNVIQGLRLAGADMIIGVDINNDKKAWGERFGMTHFVNPKEVDGDIVPYLVNMTKRGADQIGGADYTFDCTGNTKVMRQALEASHRGWGKSVVIGVAGAGQEISTRPFQLVTGRTWMGTAFGGARGRTDVPKIVDWYMDGKIQIDPMITHTLKLDDINKGFDLMHEGKSIGASWFTERRSVFERKSMIPKVKTNFRKESPTDRPATDFAEASTREEEHAGKTASENRQWIAQGECQLSRRHAGLRLHQPSR